MNTRKGPIVKVRHRIARKMVEFMVEQGIRMGDQSLEIMSAFAASQFSEGKDAGSLKHLGKIIIYYWVKRDAGVPERFWPILEARNEHYLIGGKNER